MIIQLDTSPSPTSWNNSSSANQTLSITIANKSNRILIVQIANFQASDPTISTVKIGSTSFTRAKQLTYNVDGQHTLEVWYLLNPPTGTQTITVTPNNTSGYYGCLGAVSLYNVDQTNGINSATIVTNTVGLSTTPISVSITPTQKNSWIMDVLGGDDTTGSANGNGNVTQLWFSSGSNQSGVAIGASQYNSSPTISAGNTLSWSSWGPVPQGAGIIAFEVLAITNEAVSDTLSVVESITKIVAKNITDSLSLSEKVSKSISKSISDTLSLSDSSKAIPSIYRVSDNILTTDIVAVSRSITRNVVDTLSVGDSVQKGIAKKISDSDTLSDTLSKNIVKNMSDGINIMDSISKSIVKLIRENPTITDSTSISKTLVKQISDSLSLVDSVIVARSIVRSMADNLSLGDSISKQFGKALQDNSILSEQLVKAIAKIITDNISVPDSVTTKIGSLLLNQTRKINLNNTTQQIIAEGKPRNVTI